jgi:hypothetical protein
LTLILLLFPAAPVAQPLSHLNQDLLIKFF